MKQSTQIFIYMLILTTIIILNFAVYFNGKKTDCNYCEVSFKNTQKFGMVKSYETFNYTLPRLAGNFSEGKCLIKWSRTQGYYEY